MIYAYIGCLAFGLLYSVGAVILGGHGADHGSFDNGGAHGGDSVDMPSPVNPIVIASAITTFGAAGLIGKAGFGMGDLLSSIIGLGFAGLIGALMFFGVVKFMYSSQSDSTFSLSDLIGLDAEVITPIPQNGIGEISYLINGIRYSMPARSASGAAERGEIVKIQEINGNVALTARKLSLDDFELADFSQEKSDEKEKNDNL